MGSFLVEQTITVPFSKSQCFVAVLKVLNDSSLFEVTDSSEITVHDLGHFMVLK